MSFDGLFPLNLEELTGLRPSLVFTMSHLQVLPCMSAWLSCV